MLDGMFVNVTAPDVVSNQFRGAIAGGGVYVRSPISSIQVLALDPPRLSIGCGGIDLYLGSFSFITAEKLTQFIRNVAQNAAPLAFKMAIDANFPQLGGILDKFQHMAQMMNDSQRNSCQLAHGIMDGAKNPTDVFNNLTETVTAGINAVKGWAEDFTAGTTSNQTESSTNVAKARNLKNTDNSPVLPELGNITWNALNARKFSGYIFSITDDPVMAQQVVMSLIGTSVNKEGNSSGGQAQPLYQPFGWRLRLRDLFKPGAGTSGTREVPIWSCEGDNDSCLSPTPGVFTTNGIDGFVRNKMFGSETSTVALPGSIIYNMANCASSNCSMTAGQLKFLNSIGKIPVVGLLMRAQASPQIISSIAPRLIDEMVNEVSIIYGRSVIDTAISSYAKTGVSKPTEFDAAIFNMLADLRAVESQEKEGLERLNAVTIFIDSAIRANGAVMRYRPN